MINYIVDSFIGRITRSCDICADIYQLSQKRLFEYNISVILNIRREGTNSVSSVR